MTKYAALASKAAIPQTEPLDARQVQNHQGGFIYEVTPVQRLERFLILGSDAATYYQSAREITRENARIVEEMWLSDPNLTAGLIVGISTAGRAPKNDPAIFALAMGAVSTNDEARKLALMSVSSVCRTGTHLFQFVKTAMALGKGWGRGMKRAVANWYDNKDVDKLAYQVVKYRMREALRHENVLDLAHPNPGGDEARKNLYAWLVDSDETKAAKRAEQHRDRIAVPNRDVMPALIKAHEAAMATSKASELLPIIKANPSLPWEALPTWANADPDVQKELLPNMGLTALIRNLGNLTRIGAITPMSPQEHLVRLKLTAGDDLHKSRVHPMAVLTALKVYAGGVALQGGGRPMYGSKPANTWSPNQKIVDALDKAFYLAFANAPRTGKRFFLGIDVSHSMSAPVSGSAALSCAEAAAALALVTVRTEDNTFVGRFNTGIQPVSFGDRTRLDDVLKQTSKINGGGTDCSLPMIYAMANGIPAEVFVVITDNETAHGRIHPMEALREYRRKTGINAKLIVMAMTATNFSIADPKDGGALDIVGFDASTPALIAEFAKQ